MPSKRNTRSYREIGAPKSDSSTGPSESEKISKNGLVTISIKCILPQVSFAMSVLTTVDALPSQPIAGCISGVIQKLRILSKSSLQDSC